jgi:hypothetical protein
MTHVREQFIQFLNMCQTSINYTIIAKKVAYKVQLHFELVCMDEHVY